MDSDAIVVRVGNYSASYTVSASLSQTAAKLATEVCVAACTSERSFSRLRKKSTKSVTSARRVGGSCRIFSINKCSAVFMATSQSEQVQWIIRKAGGCTK